MSRISGEALSLSYTYSTSVKKENTHTHTHKAKRDSINKNYFVLLVDYELCKNKTRAPMQPE